ncbi:MAG: hypothetical protein ACREQQ_06130 [Candidatus Binatia bacterium]
MSEDRRLRSLDCTRARRILVAAWSIGLLASTVVSPAAAGAEIGSATVIGPANPSLADGAEALQEGRVEDGVRLTLQGLAMPNTARDAAAGHSNACAGHAELKQWAAALVHCNKSLVLDDTNWRTYNNRAAVYAGKGFFDLALRDLAAGLKLAPDSHTLRRSLAIVSESKKLTGNRRRTHPGIRERPIWQIL